MGAMHNDLNRCNFMFADDRRCRNLIETPTSSLCYYHNKSAQKKSDRSEATHPATSAFFDWLSHHPLDTVTHINEALNQVFLLVVANAIPARQAESLVRMARLLLKTVPQVRDEFRIPSLLNHSPGGARFLNEIRATVLAPILQQNAPSHSDRAPASVAATFRSPVCSSLSPAPAAVKRSGAPRPSDPATAGEHLPPQAASPAPAPFHSDPAPAGENLPSQAETQAPAPSAVKGVRSPLATVSSAAASSAVKKLAEQALLDNVRELLLGLPSLGPGQKDPRQDKKSASLASSQSG